MEPSAIVVADVPTEALKAGESVDRAESRKDCRLVSLGQGVFVDDILALKLSACKLEPHPFCHVIDRRADATSGGLCIGIAPELLHPFAADLYVSESAVVLRDEIRKPRAGGRHSQRLVEDFFANILPFLFGGDGGFRDPEVSMGVARSKAGPALETAGDEESRPGKSRDLPANHPCDQEVRCGAHRGRER